MSIFGNDFNRLFTESFKEVQEIGVSIAYATPQNPNIIEFTQKADGTIWRGNTLVEDSDRCQYMIDNDIVTEARRSKGGTFNPADVFGRSVYVIVKNNEMIDIDTGEITKFHEGNLWYAPQKYSNFIYTSEKGVKDALKSDGSWTESGFKYKEVKINTELADKFWSRFKL